MRKSKTSAKALKQQEQDAQIVQLRLAGYTLQQIGAQLGGQSPQAIHKKLTRIWSHNSQMIKDDLSYYRTQQNERYERIIQGLWRSASGGSLGAVDRFGMVARQQAMLLGLNTPTKGTQQHGDDEAIAQPIIMTEVVR